MGFLNPVRATDFGNTPIGTNFQATTYPLTTALQQVAIANAARKLLKLSAIFNSNSQTLTDNVNGVTGNTSLFTTAKNVSQWGKPSTARFTLTAGQASSITQQLAFQTFDGTNWIDLEVFSWVTSVTPNILDVTITTTPLNNQFRWRYYASATAPTNYIIATTYTPNSPPILVANSLTGPLATYSPDQMSKGIDLPYNGDLWAKSAAPVDLLVTSIF